MKFTKQQLTDALKAKLTTNGKHLSISEKTLGCLSDSHYDLLVNDETELDDFANKILPQFASLNGNYEKDNADFIKKWKEEHPTPEPPKKKIKGEDENNGEDGKAKELLEMQERLKAIEEKNAIAEKEKVISVKRNELLTAFKEKGIKNGKWTERYIAKLNLTPDTDIEKETADALDIYNFSRSHSGRVTPGIAGGEDDDEVNDKMWDGLRKALKIKTQE